MMFPAALVSLFPLLALGAQPDVAPAGSLQRLPLLEPLERELTGGGVHAYTITLSAQQFLRVAVDQRGIDVVLSLFGPGGGKLQEVDSPNGAEGLETLSFIAPVSGDYRLEVRSAESKAAQAMYEIAVRALRDATPWDRLRVVGACTYAQGQRLRAQATAASLREAVREYEDALRLWREVGDVQEESDTLIEMGLALDSLGEKRRALERYLEALPLAQALGNLADEDDLLSNIGVDLRTLGEPAKALDYYGRALALARALGLGKGQATILYNMGAAWDALGEKQKALDLYEKSLPLSRSAGHVMGEATALSNTGTVYVSLGEFRRAESYFRQALLLARSAGDRRSQAMLLSNLAVVHRELGEFNKAVETLETSLRLARETGDRRAQAITLQNIGNAYRYLGDREKALDYAQQALELHRASGNRLGEAGTIGMMGQYYRELGNRERARPLLEQAASLKEALGDRPGLAGTRLELARLHRDEGDLAGARAQIEQGLILIESIRAKVASRDLRAAYLASVRPSFEFYIDLLMRLHRRDPAGRFDVAAWEASERARARTLLEFLREAQDGIRKGIDLDLREREHRVRTALSTAVDRQMQSVRSARNPAAPAPGEDEIERWTKELERLEAEIADRFPAYASLGAPQTIRTTDLQQLLEPDVVLLEYSLGDEGSFLWAITHDSLTSFELPPRKEIEERARKLHELLSARKSSAVEVSSSALELGRMLLDPVAKDIEGKRLVIVPDGVLQYVPFAVLPIRTQSGREQSLVEAGEISYLPSASIARSLRELTVIRPRASKLVAVLADPVFDRHDERLRTGMESSGSSSGDLAPEVRKRRQDLMQASRDLGMAASGTGEPVIPRLSFTRREANAIRALAPAGTVLEKLDFDANLEAVGSPEIAKYRYIHFATHGFLNSVHPELSGLILSLVDRQGRDQRGFLPATEIFNLTLPVDLVVLSGCQTALGKEIKGEGLTGLTRGFIHAGAARVLASLWKVDDVATAELMARFYRGMLGKEHLSPAAALRAAQVSLSREKRWTSPYYWAGFVLQGEWK